MSERRECAPSPERAKDQHVWECARRCGCATPTHLQEGGKELPLVRQILDRLREVLVEEGLSRGRKCDALHFLDDPKEEERDGGARARAQSALGRGQECSHARVKPWEMG